MTHKRVSVTVKAIEAVQQMFNNILEAAGRLFSPDRDRYPKSGAQPFEGDIPDRRHRHRDTSW